MYYPRFPHRGDEDMGTGTGSLHQGHYERVIFGTEVGQAFTNHSSDSCERFPELNKRGGMPRKTPELKSLPK